ncbi:membrane protein [Legionella norrlandica]|uniref:Membrane protein n=1 Tax=Legionella norrlandica TaxID=1498499 RepID=A0A0A2T9X4_9GAMM|nr:CPBP family glutamic-type intramembrane protease [Legionella norrlandica]KGP64233.1 membrane protein [Legionella norrlandica]
MIINWPMIIVLFCLSVPGVLIAIHRLVYFLLANNTEQLKKRFSRFVVFQTLFTVFIMSFAGSVLSPRTGLGDSILENLLQGKASLNAFQSILLPTVLYALLGLVIFCVLYYGLVGSILDEKSFNIMSRLRSVIGLDGCVLYGGVVEEVIARWGLMNVITFFALLFTSQINQEIIIISIFLSGFIFAVGQIPAYIAAGYSSTRRFLYSFITLSLWQSLLFGFLFWQYGLISAILAHMLFHLGWDRYDKLS